MQSYQAADPAYNARGAYQADDASQLQRILCVGVGSFSIEPKSRLLDSHAQLAAFVPPLICSVDYTTISLFWVTAHSPSTRS